MTKQEQKDATQLERVGQEIQDIYFETGARVSIETWEKSENILSTYAKTVAEEAVRAEKKRIFQKYNVSRKESKKERALSNAWNDLGNTLRNGG